MFQKLNEICEEYGCQISEFWQFKQKPSGALAMVFEEIVDVVGWKGPKRDLLKRIRRIGGKTHFSARESKLLRKLVNQQRKAGNS